VGDDPAERERFEKILAGKGHTVIGAASGEDALWQLGHGKFDAVVTNMTLRGMSGLEVADEVHAGQPNLPVVIIASQGTEEARMRPAAAGAVKFLHHPLTSAQLAETADRVLKEAEPVAASPPQASAADAAPPQAMIQFALRLRDVVLFLLAPFIGLVYLFTFPIVGLGALVWFAFKAREPVPEANKPMQPALAGPSVFKTIGIMLAVAVSGVVYAVVGPILGIGLILWVSFEAWGRLGAKAMRA
jgi:CheY-like chemotaxis protein